MTFSTSLIYRLSPAIKSNWLVNNALKVGCAITGSIIKSGLVYEETNSVVASILKAKNITVSEEEIRSYQEEIKTFFTPEQRLWCGDRHYILHPLIRILKPKVVVETGCAWGGSAAFILASLQKNGSGQLISIDVPASTVSQAKFMGIKEDQIGALIPESLRKNWKLVVGDARVMLPKVLAEVDADIFIHDSLHTTTHQAFEYVTARSLMRDNTIIASDDIRWNDAFRSFLKLHHLRGYAPLKEKNFGITVNSYGAYEKENTLFR